MRKVINFIIIFYIVFLFISVSKSESAISSVGFLGHTNGEYFDVVIPTPTLTVRPTYLILQFNSLGSDHAGTWDVYDPNILNLVNVPDTSAKQITPLKTGTTFVKFTSAEGPVASIYITVVDVVPKFKVLFANPLVSFDINTPYRSSLVFEPDVNRAYKAGTFVSSNTTVIPVNGIAREEQKDAFVLFPNSIGQTVVRFNSDFASNIDTEMAITVVNDEPPIPDNFTVSFTSSPTITVRETTTLKPVFVPADYLDKTGLWFVTGSIEEQGVSSDFPPVIMSIAEDTLSATFVGAIEGTANVRFVPNAANNSQVANTTITVKGGVEPDPLSDIEKLSGGCNISHTSGLFIFGLFSLFLFKNRKDKR